MQPGSKVLYLGAASGTTVSHVADLVGPVNKIFIIKKFIIGGSSLRCRILKEKWKRFGKHGKEKNKCHPNY